MQDRPTIAELLEAIGEYLDEDVMPVVEGPGRYHTLVAANLLAILRREAELGFEAMGRERERLESLLGHPAPPGEPRAQLLALNRELEAALAAPTTDDAQALEAAAWASLSATVLDKLAIARPGYESYDSAAEAP